MHKIFVQPLQSIRTRLNLFEQLIQYLINTGLTRSIYSYLKTIVNLCINLISDICTSETHLNISACVK